MGTRLGSALRLFVFEGKGWEAEADSAQRKGYHGVFMLEFWLNEAESRVPARLFQCPQLHFINSPERNLRMDQQKQVMQVMPGALEAEQLKVVCLSILSAGLSAYFPVKQDGHPSSFSGSCFCVARTRALLPEASYASGQARQPSSQLLFLNSTLVRLETMAPHRFPDMDAGHASLHQPRPARR